MLHKKELSIAATINIVILNELNIVLKPFAPLRVTEYEKCASRI
jgi:hypothetical protein